MTTAIINQNAISTSLTTANIKSKELLQPTQDIIALEERIAGIANKVGEQVSEIRRKQASIFHIVSSGKLYEKDGFKTFSAYVESIGFSKQVASQMVTAGRVYNDATAPQVLKEKPFTTLGAMGGVINDDKARQTLYKDADKAPDIFKTMSQDNAKEYNRAHTVAPKAKAVKTYAIVDADGKAVSDYLTLEEHEKRFSEFEIFKCPKSDKGVRWITVDGNDNAKVLHFKCYEDARKNSPVSVTNRATIRKALVSDLIKNGATLEMVNAVLKGQGLATMTEDAYKAEKENA